MMKTPFCRNQLVCFRPNPHRGALGVSFMSTKQPLESDHPWAGWCPDNKWGDEYNNIIILTGIASYILLWRLPCICCNT